MPIIDKDEIKKVIGTASCMNDVLHHFGYTRFDMTIRKFLINNNIDFSHLHMSSKNYDKVQDSQFKSIIESGKKWSDILNVFGYSTAKPLDDIKNKCNRLHIPYGHIENDTDSMKRKKSYTLEEICIANSWYSNCSKLKQRLHKELGWEERCMICKLDKWNNKPIPLEIDHINGKHFDHRLDNLRFLCPNCHAQTNTYKGKNMFNRISKSVENIPECNKNSSGIKHKCSKQEKQQHKCQDCGVDISRRCQRCVPCYNKTKFKIEWPPYEQLLRDLENSSYRQVGMKYGVSDKSVKKRLEAYEASKASTTQHPTFVSSP